MAFEDIIIKVYDVNIKQIVSMPLEEIVAQVLASRMPVNFHIEALKAQAVLIRTGIIRKNPVFGGSGCRLYPGADFCNSGHCEEWHTREQIKEMWKGSFQKNWQKILTAVEGTRGEIVVINGRPIQVQYHLCCGGATENSENVMGNRVLYLRRVLCDYCRNSPYWENARDITIEELEEKLGVKIKRASPLESYSIEGIIDHIDRDEEGRIRSVRIGGKYFKGNEVKELLGLSSTRFGWNPIILRFYTRGKGHGLGMCQYGADTMARGGSGYREIIDYYFTGVQIVNFNGFDKERPLKGKVFVIDPGHGGDDNDNRGITGLREKDVNLDIALKLAGALQDVGAEAYLTREDDTRVLLSLRADMANRVRPDFFISIHQNAFESPEVSGTEIFYFSGDQEGRALGRAIMDQLVEELGFADRGVKTANFYILREVKVSSILLELCHITNPEEEAKLKEEDFRQCIAGAICRGIIRYYNQNSSMR